MRYNRKHYDCHICQKKHYAKGYCRYHYNSYLVGRPFYYKTCYVKNCDRKVYHTRNKYLCSIHYGKFLILKKQGIQIKIKNNLVFPIKIIKWPYKNYKKIQKLKKNYCEICKIKLKKLELHHIDKNPHNSSPQNILTTCQKCHLTFHSEFKKIYGKTLQELSHILTKSTTWIYSRHRNNQLHKILTI